jgi:hypothetical protein
VSFETDRVEIDEMAYKGSAYSISSNESIPMKSAKISGTIMGNGTVNVYLKKGEERKLIFSNIIKKSIPLITGFSVKEVEGEDTVGGSKLKLDLDDIKITGENNNILSGMKLQCVENEHGMYIEKMKVSWEQDKGEKISGITINELQFWGYEKAGKPKGDQISGTELKAWGQKLPNYKIVPIDEMKFDSDITNKKIMIELYFQDYLVGFRLGDERLLIIYLDLTANGESYVEEKGRGRQTIVLERFFEQTDGSKTTKIIVEGGEGGTTSYSNGDGKIIINKSQQGSGTGGEGTGSGSSGGSTLVEPSREMIEANPGYTVAINDEGKLIKSKALEKERINFPSVPGIGLDIEVIEDPEYKEIFEEAKTDNMTIKQIVNACEETCVVDVLEEEEYEFEFEIDEGTAFNVSSIDFS